MSWRSRPVGWRGESYRHYLAAHGVCTREMRSYPAAKGFKTTTMKSGFVGSVYGVPITAQRLQQGEAYPVSPKEVKFELRQMPKEDLKGLTAVEFVRPRDKEQEQAWGQYIRSRRKILIFSQPVKNGRMDGVPVSEARAAFKDYVLKHELGHHISLNSLKTDKSLAMAEARADSYVVGMSPDDRDVAMLER